VASCLHRSVSRGEVKPELPTWSPGWRSKQGIPDPCQPHPEAAHARGNSAGI